MILLTSTVKTKLYINEKEICLVEEIRELNNEINRETGKFDLVQRTRVYMANGKIFDVIEKFEDVITLF